MLAFIFAFSGVVTHLLRLQRFRVEFVTYKWPEWLRRQSEKQRIIWGYKILFLDVLFPLNVDKVIYVDADQVMHRCDVASSFEDEELQARKHTLLRQDSGGFFSNPFLRGFRVPVRTKTSIEEV